MRVARIITRLNVGGPSIQAVSLSHHLTPRGFDTLLIHGRLGPREGDMSYLLDAQPARAIFVPSLQRAVAPVTDVRALFRIYRLLARFKPHLVHTHMAKAGAAGRLAAVMYNRTVGLRAPAKIVHTYHGHVLEGYFSPQSARRFAAIERFLARHTDVIVAISPQIARDIVETFRIARADQIRIVPLGFDLAPFAAIDDDIRQRSRDELQIPRDAAVIATVGRLTAVKQPELFLDVAAHVARGVPNLVVLIVGDGDLRPFVEQTVDRLGLRNRVRLVGWRQDLARIYAATDVFVLTSRNEGTPVALIEAMASGVPGVSTDVGGIRHVINDPSVGRVVQSANTESMAAEITGLLQDATGRRQMGELARSLVLTRFSLPRLVNDIAEVYRELGPERKGSIDKPTTASSSARLPNP